MLFDNCIAEGGFMYNVYMNNFRTIFINFHPIYLLALVFFDYFDMRKYAPAPTQIEFIYINDYI